MSDPEGREEGLLGWLRLALTVGTVALVPVWVVVTIAVLQTMPSRSVALEAAGLETPWAALVAAGLVGTGAMAIAALWWAGAAFGAVRAGSQRRAAPADVVLEGTVHIRSPERRAEDRTPPVPAAPGAEAVALEDTPEQDVSLDEDAVDRLFR